ncbi:hypothetical protein [Paracoccus sp. SCSIO 75233]|uniref:hypothetical protein n=1 Tax=Paracoccus sp. SCSIO 75233 TaxID=3017782 RepID=UPI0022F0344F|nr:hypothetical protein [Paracoccus sp. SCSIO 75233]WBU55408.1 hypothetical protein PAF12_18745 [Paracoccus sp. SCSIO 75233]
MTLSLDAAIRTILLPVAPGTGEEYAQRAEDILNDLGIVEDHADWVNLEIGAWELEDGPSQQLKEFIARLLFSPGEAPESFALDASVIPTPPGAQNVLSAFSSRYFEMHERVMADEKCDHRQARRILSHTHSLLLLATGEKMTASRIYSMMQRDGIDLGRSWSTPRYILERCGLAPSISVQEVRTLFTQDAIGEADLLGDLDLENCIAYVAAVCRGFGYSGDLADQLRTLFVTDLHPPYLCMLHFQLTAQSMFNHRLTNAYEFAPRGEPVLWLSAEYNRAGLDVGMSPFLNNAKSVDTLDAAWAASKKKKERHAARALVDLLTELDRLSDPSRSAAGQYLRALLHRMLRISLQNNTALTAPLPQINAESAQKLLVGVAAGNTGTRGVIEQRLTDCIALREAGDLTRWRLRGFGDSVFTTNTSQKKLGDAELKHATENRIVAVEAHGGRLTEKYVQDHLFTMRNVLPLRLEELEDRAPIGDWSLELQFFAHDLDAGLSEHHIVEGLPVNINYRRYADISGMVADADFLALLRTYFTDPLNAVHVHSRTRQAVLNLI